GRQAAGALFLHWAGLSSLPWTAASAAWKPIFECVPSQNGLFVDPPQRHSANGRLATAYSLPFQSTTFTSSPSTLYEPFCLTVIVAIVAPASSTHFLHRRQEFGVRPGLRHLVEQQLHRFDRRQRAEHLSQDPDAIE